MENKIIINGLLAFTAVNDCYDLSKYFVYSTRGRNLKNKLGINKKHKRNQTYAKVRKGF